MLTEFLKLITGKDHRIRVTSAEYMQESNLSVIRVCAVLVILVSLYWLIIDTFSANYSLALIAKVGVWAQMLSSLYICFLPNLAKGKSNGALVRISYIVYYGIIIAGVSIIIATRNQDLLASGADLSNQGVSMAAFYLFAFSFMPLPSMLDTVIVSIMMIIGLLVPAVVVKTSTYSLFGYILLSVCFCGVFYFFRKKMLDSATRQAENVSLNNSLIEFSYSDPLTTILNRRSLNLYFEYCEKNRLGETIGVILFDIDYFKKYNDFYGHIAGDDAILKIALKVKESLKDIPEAFVFRYGGGEFIVLISNPNDEMMVNTMTLIKESVYEANIKRDDNCGFSRLTVTVGGAIETITNDNKDYVIAADNQLYLGKNNMRNNVYYKDTCHASDFKAPVSLSPKKIESAKQNDADSETIPLHVLESAICAEIVDIYCVNIFSKKITTYRHDGNAIGVDEYVFGGNYDEAMDAYVKYNVHPTDRSTFRTKTDFDSIVRQLRKKDTVNIYYKALKNDDIKYYQMRCIRMGSAISFENVIVAFLPEDVDISKVQDYHAMETDEITGVYTKQAFMRYANQLLKDNPDTEYTFVISDIENFKLINSIYGDSEGNALLRYLADSFSAIEECKLIGRYSGDQFIMVFESSAYKDADEFMEDVERIKENSPLAYIIIKYGINSRVNRSDSVIMMSDKASLALNSIKHVSDAAAAYYDKDLVAIENRRQMYEALFERAISNKEFAVYAQPKYDSNTQEINGAEALIRWIKSDGSLIPPGEFIPVYEKCGLISTLDKYVFRLVCQEQRNILDQGMIPVPVSVNLSRNTLFQQNIIETYSKIIEEYNLDKKYVPLELTESAATDSTKIVDLVKSLKDAGFVLHMDDFGSGYSSLSSLSSLPFDVVKLDKSLIDSIGNQSGEEMIKHIVELSHFLNMQVVAEGVETAIQLNFLKKLGCDTIQGFLLGRPMPRDLFYQLLLDNADIIAANQKRLEEGEDISTFRLTNDIKLQYLQALGSVYMTMHVIDLADDTVAEFSTTTNVKAAVNKAHGCVSQMEGAMRATVAPDYLNEALEFTDLRTIKERMRGKRVLSEEFNGVHFGWFKAQFVVITSDENDEPVKLMFTTQVVKHKTKNEKTYVNTVRTDELTGVFNRYAYDEELMAYANPNNLELSRKPYISAMMVDINELRYVNDEFGQVGGDELIWATADLLNNCIGRYGKVFRIGGDEFAALIDASSDELSAIEDDIVNGMKKWMGTYSKHLDFAYGIASRWEFPLLSVDDLFKEADKRMFRKKAER